jgi:hypothetical protein
MRTRALASYLAILMIPAWVGQATPARAEAWELKLGLGPAFATEFDPLTREGLGGQVYAQLGVSEIFSLTAGAGYLHHFLGSGLSGQVVHVGLGLAASLDVLVVVPYLELRLGYLWQQVENQPRSQGLGLTIALGADYLWTDRFTAGLALEYHGLLTDFDVLPAYLSVNLRMGLRFLD